MLQTSEEFPLPLPSSVATQRQPGLTSVEEEEAFWDAQFAELPTELELPLDRPRSQLRSFQVDRAATVLDVGACLALRRLATAQGCSLYDLLLGTFTLLMRRLSGQDDVVVGASSQCCNRSLEDGTRLLANIAAVRPVRSSGAATQPFGEYLAHIQCLITKAAQHDEYFFPWLLKRLDLVQNPTRQSLFSVLFNFDKDDVEENGTGLVRTDFSYASPRGTVMVDLALDVVKDGAGLDLRCDFSAELFERSTVQRWLLYYQKLLKSILADPEARICDLPLLEDADREQILQGWNGTGRPYPAEGATLHGLIEAQAERTPNAVAVSCEGEALTYGELNARANRLAHRLRMQGVGPECLVGVLAERSVEMIIGLVGTLKAGGAYLPLDPAQPSQRLEFMLQDASPVLVLVQRALASKVSSRPILVLEEDDASASSDNPVSGAGPDTLAYVIYTSGSTGVPKGVMNTHAGICNFTCWLQEAFRLGPADRVLQKTAFTFDVSLGEIFGALVSGAGLVMARPGLHGDTRYLADAAAHHGITVLWFVTPVLAAFLHEPSLQHGGSLRHVVTGGESLSREVIEHFVRVLPHAQLHNFYGPTETVVAVTAWPCQSGREEGYVPIGGPVANTQAYILDRIMQPVPLGVAGELHIGGAQVGRGYLNRVELTVEKFVVNPFGKGRLYKTGDRCRYHPGGLIEFLGRLDQQVKIRGFRIELGEIEATLQQHPAVSHAAVVVREQPSGERQLVAYVVGNSTAPAVSALREFLASKLPGHMVPTAIMVLEKLPLTAHGKLDRKALPDPTVTLDHATVAPRNAVETKLAAIWEKVLAVQPIGVTDNFFELGGSSLTAVGLFLEVRRAFGENLPLTTLLQAPTVEQLAGKLAVHGSKAKWDPVVAIQPEGSRPPFFAVHGVHGNVLFYRQLAQLLGKEQPFYGIQSQGLDGKAITRTSIEAMAEYYLQEIRKLQPHGPYLMGGYSLGGSIVYEMARQLRLEGEEVPLLVLIDAQNPARPARLTSYRARLSEAWRDPASLFTVDRFARILAGRIRGKVGDRVLKWNDQYHNARARRRRNSRQDDAAEVDHHVVMVHTQANLAYRPLPFDGKMTLFRSNILEPGYEFEPYLGWDSLPADGVEVHEVPGTHLELFADENMPILAKTLDQCIRLALLRGRAEVKTAPNLTLAQAPTGMGQAAPDVEKNHQNRASQASNFESRKG